DLDDRDDQHDHAGDQRHQPLHDALRVQGALKVTEPRPRPRTPASTRPPALSRAAGPPPPRPPVAVPAPVGRRLRVAVRAQKLDVLEPVVAPVAVSVVELHAERLAQPLGDPADLAAVLLEARLNQTSLEIVPASLDAARK